MKKEKNLAFPLNSKKYPNKVFFSFIYLLSCLLIFIALVPVATDAKISKSHAKHKHRTHIIKRKHTPEEEVAAREAAAAVVQEAKLIEGRNLVFAKAYRLFDSGTNESLQGNYKYAVLQLKLADELLQEHGQTNTSLAVANLVSLSSSAQCIKDYTLAKSACKRLLALKPQDTQLLLKLAEIEMAQGNFHMAHNELNRIVEIEPNNAEAKLLSERLQSHINQENQ